MEFFRYFKLFQYRIGENEVRKIDEIYSKGVNGFKPQTDKGVF